VRERISVLENLAGPEVVYGGRQLGELGVARRAADADCGGGARERVSFTLVPTGTRPPAAGSWATTKPRPARPAESPRLESARTASLAGRPE
jgi:hypothetical protein